MTLDGKIATASGESKWITGEKARAYGMKLRQGADANTAEELAQEVFLRIYRTRKKYHPTAKFSTWLFTIAGNVASNALRTKSRRKEVHLAPRVNDSAPQSLEAAAQAARRVVSVCTGAFLAAEAGVVGARIKTSGVGFRENLVGSGTDDLRDALDIVAKRAALLCAAPFSRLMLIDGDVLRPAAEHWAGPTSSSEKDALTLPVPITRTSVTGRAAIDRATVHHADIVPLLDSEYKVLPMTSVRSMGLDPVGRPALTRISSLPLQSRPHPEEARRAVSKDGQRARCSFPCFETLAALAPQHEVVGLPNEACSASRHP